MRFQTSFLCLFYSLTGVGSWDEEQKLRRVGSQNWADPTVDTVFYYFAYGSNMLEKRFRVKCPDATFYGAALLKDHRLDFTMEAPWWNGAVATICKDPSSEVWGTIWMLKILDMEKLEEQEGVSAGWYHSEEVIVYYEGKSTLKAITFVQNHNPKKLHAFDTLPFERQPSLTYLKVMILGAVQAGIPDDYIQFLYTIRHNGKVASQELIDKFIHTSKNTKLLL